MIVIKNIQISPHQIPNDGTARINVRCMVFTKTDHAAITSVWVDMLHTELYQTYIFQPNPNQLIKQTLEGEYFLSFHIPWLMDTGKYLLIVRAKNDKNETGRAVGEFEIYYRRPDKINIQTSIFQSRLENLTQAQFIEGNICKILEKGDNALNTRLKLISEAKSQINIQTYMLGQTGAGRKVLNELFKKSAQGVEVNLILNADTQISSPISTIQLKLNQILGDLVKEDETGLVEWFSHEFLDMSWIKTADQGGMNVLMLNGDLLKGPRPAHESGMKKADFWLEKLIKDGLPKITEKSLPKDWKSFFRGPGGLPSMPLLDYAVHEKLMIVDGKTAIVGGRNLENQYFDEWFDLECLITGPVVNEIQRGFLKTFQSILPKANVNAPKKIYSAEKQSHANHCVLFVQSRPWHREYHTLKAIAASIQASTSHCYIRTQYIVLPDCFLKEVLINEAQRGLDIRMIINSFQTSQHLNFGVGYFVTLNYIKSLIDAGIRIYEQKGLPEGNGKDYHHTKEFLFDQHLMALGSFNVTVRSAYIESENLLFTKDPTICKQRESRFLADIEHRTTEINTPYLIYLHNKHRSKMDLSQLVDILF
jgi:phosphatidylserine/phosphatidylglycerophosphate/cardiolipin synthase-like enzyme